MKIHFGTDAPEACTCMGLFYNYRESKLANRHESSWIPVNSCPIRAAFGVHVFLTNSYGSPGGTF